MLAQSVEQAMTAQATAQERAAERVVLALGMDGLEWHSWGYHRIDGEGPVTALMVNGVEVWRCWWKSSGFTMTLRETWTRKLSEVA